MNNWRFLNTGANDCYHNMAIDEVLAIKSVPHDKRSVFRVYRWQPYAISLGYNQDPNDLDQKKCKQDKIQLDERMVVSQLTQLTEKQKKLLHVLNCSYLVSPKYLADNKIISIDKNRA